MAWFGNGVVWFAFCCVESEDKWVGFPGAGLLRQAALRTSPLLRVPFGR